MIIDRGRVERALPAYEIADTLGRGGYGLVLAGRHRRLGRDVAIKVLSVGAGGTGSADGADQGAFVREARMLAALDHPHVVRIYDYVESDDLCLLVMERLPGGSMRARATKGLTVDVVCAVGLAAAAALGCAHAAGVLHRDIKPDNMLFAEDGLLKVTDFGIAKLLGDAGTVASTLVGTPVYMAPEQIDGRPLGPGCDLYALGVVLYELLSGRPPFPRTMPVLELMNHHLHVTPGPLATAPPAIAAVVERALGKHAGARQPSARAFALDLASAAARTFDPGWLARCPLPLRLDDDVRDAARGVPHVVPARTPPRSGPSPAADGTGGTDARTVGMPPTGRPPLPPTAVLLGPPAPTPPASPPLSAPAPTPAPPPPFTPATTPPPPPLQGAGAPPRRGRRGAGRRVGLGRGDRRGARQAGDPPAPLKVEYPYCVAVSPGGAVFVSQRLRSRIVRIDADGATTRIAGTGKSGLHGDGGPAVDAELDNPCGLALGADGSVYVADSFNNRVRRIDPDGRITTVAGSGQVGPPVGVAAQHASTVGLTRPHGVAVDPDGRIHIANTGGHQVVSIDPDGRAAPLAGGGVPGMSGDGGAGQFAQLRRPHDVAARPGGMVYIADTDNRVVRAVDPSGMISTAAGVFYGGSSAERVPAATADVGRPQALAVTVSGGLLIADPDGGRVRLMTAEGFVHTVAHGVERPFGVAAGPDGTIYVVDTARHLIHRIPAAAV